MTPGVGSGLIYMTVLHVDVDGIERCDCAIVDTLARVQLALKQEGWELQIRGASDQLCELIAFMGLADVLRVESRR